MKPLHSLANFCAVLGGVVLTVITLMTIFLGWQASHLRLDSGFEKQLPKNHPYIQVLRQHQAQFGGGNTVLLAVSQKEGQGDIYNGPFLASLKTATDAVFYLPGVDRTRALQCLTAAIYFEARSESDQGQRRRVGEETVEVHFLQVHHSILEAAQRLLRQIGQGGKGGAESVGHTLINQLVN